MSRTWTAPSAPAIALVVLELATFGCNPEPPGVIDPSTGSAEAGEGSADGASSSTGGAEDDATGADDTTGGERPPLQSFVDCIEVDPEVLASELDPEAVAVTEVVGFPSDVVCPDLEGSWPTLQVVVTYPDPMPDTAVPVLFFAHGALQEADGYQHLFDPIAREHGFVSVSISASGDAQDRTEQLACALRWLRWEPDPMGEYSGQGRPSAIGEEHLGCSITLGGHSRGGAAAWLLAQFRTTAGDYLSAFAPEGMTAQRLDALFLVAPNTDGIMPGSLASELAVPTVVLGTEVENDPVGRQMRLYDRIGPERQPSTPGRHLIETYVVPHHGFGGSSATTPLGAAILREYVSAFLGWRVLDRDAAESRALLTTERFPDSILELSPDPWANHPIYQDRHFSGGIDCTAITVPATCSATSGCVLRADDSCVGRPLVLSSFVLDDATLGETRLVLRSFEPDYSGPENLFYPVVAEGPTVSIGDIEVLLDPTTSFTNGVLPAHETALGLAEWGGSLQGTDGTLRVDFPAGLDATAFTHLSMRIGQVAEIDDQACAIVRHDPIELDLEIRDDDPTTDDPMRAMQPLVRQDAIVGSLMDECTGCCATQFMHTQRFPLADFCAQGPISIDDLDGFVLHLPEETQEAHVILDTIELTHSAFDEPEPGTECPGQSFRFACEVDDLVVTRTTCDGEPTARQCDSGDVVQTSVSPPWVDDESSAGWVVHVPAGWVRDPEDLSSTEEAAILDLCTRACDLEWSDVPWIAPDDCAATGAFLAPTPLSGDSHRAFRRIPSGVLHGEGLFGEQVLDCSLRSDCCEAFGEDLCAARPERSTEASAPLHRGEQWIASFTGHMQAESTYAAAPVEADLSGTVGYSRCTNDGGEDPCPFYVGSLSLQLDEPLAIELDCNGVPQTHELATLAVELAQPAFGITDGGSS